MDRNGLRCLSDTKLMSSGKTMGDGIYLADSFIHSAKYALRSGCDDGWNNGMLKEGYFFVVGICEVISSPSIKEESGICVVPKESEGNVAVRYLLVCKRDVRDDIFEKDLRANISNGHILSHGAHTVDLSEHHQKIKRKYASWSLL